MPNDTTPCKRKSKIDALAKKALEDLEDVSITPLKDLSTQLKKVETSLKNIALDPHKPK
jgi:hypothetical protein